MLGPVLGLFFTGSSHLEEQHRLTMTAAAALSSFTHALDSSDAGHAREGSPLLAPYPRHDQGASLV